MALSRTLGGIGVRPAVRIDLPMRTSSRFRFGLALQVIIRIEARLEGCHGYRRHASANRRRTSVAAVRAAAGPEELSPFSHPTKDPVIVIDLYTWSTPNGRKVSIALEEFGLEYETHPINIGADEQFHPDFLKISPNNKIPAIVDRDNGLSLMESGAILVYLADKTGKFMPSAGEGRWRVLEWLMWQMGGAGPMLGQVHHFVKFNPGKSEYAERRFRTEADRLYGVMNDRLESNRYLAGDEYTIADMAAWPWISRYEWQEIDFADFPNVRRWYVEIADRPAVQRGYHVPRKANEIPIPD